MSSLAQRLQQVLDTYKIDDTALAATLGLSTPMLASLTSGQRDRITNETVYERLQRLEELAATPEVQTGGPSGRQSVLEAVGASERFRGNQRIEPTTSARDTAAVYLAGIAETADLERAAAAVPSTELADLLAEALNHAR